MTDTTHRCPAPGCERRLPPPTFACREHWYALPWDLRVDLAHTYRHAFGETRYWQVRARCLHALGVALEDIPDANAGVGLPAGG